MTENAPHAEDSDEFYVRRVNWLVTAGRSDLIDEIADDCETRRSTHGRVETTDGHTDTNPVDSGTKVALALLGHSTRR